MPNVPISGFTVPANTVGIGLTGYSLTGSSALSMIDLAGTWNTSGTPTALKLNVTDTASNASSLLMDLQVGGSSRFSVTKAGGATANSSINVLASGNSVMQLAPVAIYGYHMRRDYSVTWGSNSVALDGSIDLTLTRRGAANLRLGAADTGSNTSTVTITIATPGVVTWNSHGLSTGTPVFFTTTGALPTGITASTTYYVIAVDANTFQIATSFANALAGTAVNTSGSQSGTQTGNRNAITQRLSVQSVTGVTDRPGADLVITGSQGTGNAAGGSIIFQVAPAGSSGNSQNALQNVFLLPGVAGEARIINASGGSGNLTIASTANTNASITFRFSADTLGSGGSVAGFAGRISGNFGFFDSSGTNLIVGQPSGSTDSISIWGTDVRLARDAADTLALRRSTNAQTFRVYNTFTDASNYERGFVQWSSNVLQIGAEALGTGTLRNVQIPLSDNGNILIIGGSTSGTTFGVDEDGALLVRRMNSSAFGLSMGSRGGSGPNTITLGAATRIAFSSVNQPDGDSTIDASLSRLGAGIIGVLDGASGGAALSFVEQTAPAAPGANGVYIYAVDNGSGKTQLMALFATGAAQQIAIEP